MLKPLPPGGSACVLLGMWPERPSFLQVKSITIDLSHFSINPHTFHVCRVYATELVAYFEQHGWTCDDCKACIVCDQSPSESEKSEDLLVMNHFIES